MGRVRGLYVLGVAVLALAALARGVVAGDGLGLQLVGEEVGVGADGDERHEEQLGEHRGDGRKARKREREVPCFFYECLPPLRHGASFFCLASFLSTHRVSRIIFSYL